MISANQTLLPIIALSLTILSCGLKTAQEAGLQFSTELSPLPADLEWREIGFAKELMNQKELMVVISGGSKPLPLKDWDSFKARYPYRKNIDRNLLFQKTAFYRSPGRPADCAGRDCITEVSYQGYTWIEMAKPICVDYVPSKTDLVTPEKGHLSIKTIQKCQALLYEGHIYQLTDNQGNYYVMHAYESGQPDTSVVLPDGWTLRRVELSEPFIVSPFGGGDDCYFNIVGDHLGQGYHQYQFANEVYRGYQAATPARPEPESR